MIGVKFPPLIGPLRTYLLANTVGVAVRREEPAENKPTKLVVLNVAYGARVNEVSRLARVTARIRVSLPSPNQGTPDFDGTGTLATQITNLLEQAHEHVGAIQDTTDSNGPYSVTDDRKFEFQTVFVEYQVRGQSL